MQHHNAFEDTVQKLYKLVYLRNTDGVAGADGERSTEVDELLTAEQKSKTAGLWSDASGDKYVHW